MRIAIVFQAFAIFWQYRIVSALYGFGGFGGFGDEPEDPKRVRIYLDDDEKLLVPKNSKVEYVNPVIEIGQDYVMDKPPVLSSYIAKVIKKPLYLPPQQYQPQQYQPQQYQPQQFYPKPLYEKPAFTLEDLRIKSDISSLAPDSGYFGGYLGGQATSNIGQHQISEVADSSVFNQAEAKQSAPVAYGKLLRPILLLPNGWIHGVNIEASEHHEKPVTEERPDDLKYDFRTQMHSIR